MPSRYDTVLAALDAGVVIHAADTTILEANERARALLGISDLEGRLATDPQWVFFEADYSPMVVERFPVMQVIATRQPMPRMMMIVRGPDRLDVWAEANATPILDDQGELSEIAVTFIDVTARESRRRAAKKAAAQLRESANYSRRLLEASPDPLVTISPAGMITDVNVATETITGLHRRQLIGTDFSVYFTDPDAARAGYEQAFRDGKVVDYPLELAHISGRVTPVLYNATVYRNEQGEVLGVFAAARDITATKAANDALRRSEQLFRLVMDGAPQGVAVVGLRLEFQQVNRELCAILGRSEPWLLSHTLDDVILADDLATNESGNDELLSGRAVITTHENQWLRADGSTVWVVHSTSLLCDERGAPLAYICHMQDNTDAHRIREELTHRANHDRLTGLINREELQTQITQRLGRLQLSEGVMALLFCDIDAFKNVNDTYGHDAGDEVLRVTAHRIDTTIRHTDIAARIGGDEFVVLLDDVPDKAAAITVAEKIRHAIAEPVGIGGGRTISVAASVGVVMASPGLDAHRLLRNADAALYEAKDAGRDRISAFHDVSLSSIASEVHKGLRDGQFVPWFQPIVEMGTGRIVGFESLARWMRPDGTCSTPAHFLSDAERSNLIIDLDHAVLDQSVAVLAALPPPLHVAVNVSAATLINDHYTAYVLDALERFQVDAHRLHLEFTETTLLSVTTDVHIAMERLAEVGVRWYVDDFGTGYSSIAHLRDLPVAGLKLDRSFTSMLGSTDPTCERLASALVGLARGLGLDTVAEGTETEEQAAILREQGWTHAQGWLYGHPMPHPSDLVPLELLGR